MQTLVPGHKPRRWGGVLSFLLPMMIMTVIYGGLRIYPFGFRSLLTIDLRQQYIAFYTWWKEALGAGQGIAFSLNKGMGGEMVGLIAYYLMSPFLFLFWLTPQNWVPEVVVVITLLKLGSAGLTMYFFLSKEPGGRPWWQSVVFSTGYALMAYNIVFQHNVMWLDGVALLPLVALGLQRIARREGPVLYVLSLWAAIVTNYYIGAMICIFSVMYFAYLLAREPVKEKGRATLTFVCASCVAGGLAAWLLVPLLSSLAGGKNPLGSAPMSWRENFPLVRLAAQWFSGTFAWEQYISGMPNLYVGLLALVCAGGGLFVGGPGSVRRRVADVGFLLVLIVFLWLQPLNLLFHGLSMPSWFYFRQSFLLSFVLVVMAQRGLDMMERRGKTWIPIAGAMTGLVLLVLTIFASNHALGPWRIVINGVVLMGGALALVLWIRKHRRWAAGLMILVQCFDLGLHAWWVLRVGKYEPRTVYGQYLEQVQDAQGQIAAHHGEADPFYRMEKTYSYSPNDAMLYNYWGLTHFSSSEKNFVRKFIGRMGLVDSGMWGAYLTGGTMSVDSLLGVRYVLSKAPYLQGAPYYQQIGTVPQEGPEQGEDVVGIYENPYALPLGFMVHSQVAQVRMDNENVFEIQNEIFSSMVQGGRDLYEPVVLGEPSFENLELDDTVSDKRYRHVVQGQPAKVTYSFAAPSEDPLYLYCAGILHEGHEVELYVNDEYIGQYFHWSGFGVVSLGSFAPGTQVTLEMRLKDSYLILGQVLVCAQNTNELAADAARLKEQSWVLTEAGGSTMAGSVAVREPDQLLLITIPQVEGWRATVDGQPVEIQRVLDALVAVPVPEGTHEVVLRFTPPGLWVGVALSGATLLGSAAIWLWMRRRRQKRNSSTSL